jgi:hypothetical protein
MTLVTRLRSRRSRAWRRREGKSTWRVTRRERCVALRLLSGLLLLLFGRPDSGAGAAWDRELNMEVNRSRGEGRRGLEEGFGICLKRVCRNGIEWQGRELQARFVHRSFFV